MYVVNLERLRDIREDKDITQEEMAANLGVKRSAYSLWELGINIIPLKYLCLFADFFGYSIDYVLGLSNNRVPKNLKKGFDIHVLGNNMKEIRLKNGLSQENVANILGVSQPAITRYEKGIVDISISNLYKFSKEFNVSFDVLYGRVKK